MTLEERDQRMREEGFKEGFKEGFNEGREEASNYFSKLISFLMEKGLIEEAQKAISDIDYGKELIEKYDLL